MAIPKVTPTQAELDSTKPGGKHRPDKHGKKHRHKNRHGQKDGHGHKRRKHKKRKRHRLWLASSGAVALLLCIAAIMWKLRLNEWMW